MLNGDLRGLDQTLADPVTYKLTLHDHSEPLNCLIDKELTIRATGEKHCVSCGRSVNKLFQNGYCFPCVRTLAECDLCIVKPHECHFHLGTCRDEQFGLNHCMIPHFVYIAWSSGFKVGLTRKGRQLKRWMDQGATLAAVIAEVPTRKLAGELEMHIAENMNDKTDWRKMLREELEPDRTIEDVHREVLNRISSEYRAYMLDDIHPTAIRYPRVADFQVNLKSMNLDKEPVAKGTLRGIKGQYLLFDEGILNVRKYSGYAVEILTS